VDIYDANMTLLVSGASLMRVSDISFTFTHAAIPTAAFITGHGVDWTKYDSSSKNTGVHIDWKFDLRKQALAASVAALIEASDPGAAAAEAAFVALYGSYPPDWYGGQPGIVSATIDQFTYPSGACPATVGIVPMSGSPATAVEKFKNQYLIAIPDAPDFDEAYSAHGQGAIYLTQPDALWQSPFKPSCNIIAPDALQWLQDDGSGQPNSESISEGGATLYKKYFAHHPLVEATTSSAGLPAGVKSHFDTSNTFAPSFWPTGIPIGDDLGNYGSFYTDWGFKIAVCGNTTRFLPDYAYVVCT
jgi:hypothetical protein